MTKGGKYPMPPEHEHCHRLVQLSEEDITSVVKSIPKLDTLILIKRMLKNHSFQNPFLSAIGNSSVAKGLVSRISKLERFQSSRSNSAPGNYQNHEACSSVDTSTNDLNVESPVEWGEEGTKEGFYRSVESSSDVEKKCSTVPPSLSFSS